MPKRELLGQRENLTVEHQKEVTVTQKGTDVRGQRLQQKGNCVSEAEAPKSELRGRLVGHLPERSVSARL